ncbi:hypothetical protein AAFF_G00155570 [Aldrovandia affinis]|uniref:Uncharacterized protein n=1 Tax=Aldrovandia affinis TaxID=143900 RepID=A0AAD7T026_9TELE|nr:hypothetical protein AAFF_G00155570 [Aldrovandia affinis]
MTHHCTPEESSRVKLSVILPKPPGQDTGHPCFIPALGNHLALGGRKRSHSHPGSTFSAATQQLFYLSLHKFNRDHDKILKSLSHLHQPPAVALDWPNHCAPLPRPQFSLIAVRARPVI